MITHIHHSPIRQTKGGYLKGWVGLALGAILAACFLTACEAGKVNAHTLIIEASERSLHNSLSLLDTSGVQRNARAERRQKTASVR
eukprot:4898421-Pyramimonas_sp.AAC.1